jgi:hypothetical protein
MIAAGDLFQYARDHGKTARPFNHVETARTSQVTVSRPVGGKLSFTSKFMRKVALSCGFR